MKKQATKATTKPKAKTAPVIVRTYSAGVHYGTLVSHKGQEVVLKDARRIWRWFGANTLNELSLRGLDASKSRVSEPVAKILLTQAIEILPVTKAAIESIGAAKWATS